MANWVLLRGLGRDKRHWYTFKDKIENTFSGNQILPLNLPGIESSENIPTNIQAMTDEVREKWLQEKESEGPWNILAISLGGMIAIDWCHRYPEDFKHLVTINTSSKTTSPTFDRITLPAISAVAKSLFIKDTREREKKVLEITTNDTEITEEMLDFWEEVAADMKLNRLSFAKQLYAASKFKLPEKLPIPFTVLASKADRFCKYTCSEKIAQRYNAPLHLHESGGHDLSTDAGEWIIEHLKNI